jgi:pimeloyl-ACP methyl ester carboxylesterase
MASESPRKTPRRSPPRTRATPSDEALPPGIDPMLLNAMSLRVPTRSGTERRLSTQEVEHALLAGEHAQTLEMYFGEAEYAELRQLAARATRRHARAGPRVLILPGIMGSMLARVRNDGSTDTIWVDLIDIARGRLQYLTLPDTVRIAATDVFLPTYLRLKLTLQDQGFNADFHPFDWRRSIPDLGRELAERVRADPAREVLLVAHSMGGLVARAAVHAGMTKLKRLVMLGTPNFGSFAPAMVFRGVYPFVNKLAALDLRHSAVELAARVFNTFPGLTQMLPQRARWSAVDLYDVQKWPTAGARPLPRVLEEALPAQQKLAIVPEKYVLIAGVDRETTVGLRVADGEFVFQRSRAGDGTVPIELAMLPDVLTYYLTEEHGALPRNGTVQRAVVDILRNGATPVLSDSWSRTRADSVVEVPESELRQRYAGQAERAATRMSASDLRNIIAEFAAPAAAGIVQEPGAAAPPATALAGAFEALVIARRRQRRIDLRLARGSVTQVRSRAYVLGLFENVAPAGAASAVDALMDGAISEFRQRRMFSSAVGEIFVVPGGRNEVCADFIVFAGLGHFDSFSLQVLETVAENIARTLSRINVEEFATVSIGSGTGFDVEQALEALLRGFFRGLEDADRDQAFRSITLCEVDEARYDLLKWALYRLSSTELFAGVEVTLTELKLPPAPIVRRPGAADMPPSIYLTVRTAREGRNLRFESSLLTTGGKATVMSGETLVAEATLRENLEKIESERFSLAAMPQFGAALAALVLDGAILAGLEGCFGNHLVVVHDAEASRVPWETLHVTRGFPALEGGMSRRYLAANLSVAKWLEARREDEWLDILLVVDPTQDLQGARAEGERIQKLFGDRQRVRLTRIDGAAATRARLRAEFGSGQYDILHYAGHAYFDAARVARSGVLCSDGPLTGAELADLGTLPSLVFFNACESARVRRNVKRESRHVTRDLKERLERSVGLAEAFLRGGVANYIGTYWPVGDDSAMSFAQIFYGALLAGETLGDAILKGRAQVKAGNSIDWADYIFYGSVDFRVKAAHTSN